MRAANTSTLTQIRQQRNRLQRFSKTHLIRKNPINAIIMQSNEPIQPLQLIRMHFTNLTQIGRLSRQTCDLTLTLSRLHQCGILCSFRHATFAPSGCRCFAFFALLFLFIGSDGACEKMRKHLTLRQEVLETMLLSIGTSIRGYFFLQGSLLRRHKLRPLLLCRFEHSYLLRCDIIARYIVIVRCSVWRVVIFLTCCIFVGFVIAIHFHAFHFHIRCLIFLLICVFFCVGHYWALFVVRECSQ
mmetsp:Transcript_6365/g.9361  ORF Transcript_6365/g.9361 Transcript_6365/m.9361 type:complete len:243 (-) Transcript_6365:75-803(-)